MTKVRSTTRSLIIAGIATLLTPSALFAQDSQPSSSTPLAAPARPPVDSFASAPTAPRRAPAPYQWSGFYLGANIGYGGGDAKTTFSIPDFGGTFDPQTLNAEPMGWTWGFQGGSNFRWAGFVAGFEADFTKSDIAGNTSVSPFKFDGDNINGVMTVDQSLDWFSTFRGRFGVATSRMLFFGTAGIALGHIDHFSSLSDGADQFPVSEEGTRWGWTIGAGVEGAIGSRMSWRAQYLFLDLGEGSTFDDAGVKHAFTSKNNTFSGGINFRF